MTTVWIYKFSDGTCLKLLDKGLSSEEVWKMELMHGACEVLHWCMMGGEQI